MRLFAAFLFALLLTAPVFGDEVVYWPATGQRVYVLDIENIGAYGKITKPPGIDVIVVRHGNKWGVLPSNLYQSKPQPRSSLRFNTQLPPSSGYGKATPYVRQYGR